jgi:Dimerisation domain/O-methyltransferase domain
MPLTGRLPQRAVAQARADAVLQMITGHWVAQTVRAGAHLRVADHVGGGARTAPEVATLEGSDPGATYRLMRAMASLGLLGYEGQGKFSVTELGEVLREDAPGSLRSAALARSGPGVWEQLGLLPEAVRRGRGGDGDIFGFFGANEEAARVFSNCRAAGGPGARALIVEALIGEVGKPDPVALFDMNMLAVSGGRQRSLEELDALCAASGWRRTGLSGTRTTDSLLELEAT